MGSYVNVTHVNMYSSEVITVIAVTEGYVFMITINEA